MEAKGDLKISYSKPVYVKIALVILSLVSIWFIFVSVVNPSIIGYTIFQEVKSLNSSVEDYSKSIQELSKDLLVSNTNLSSCSSLNEKLFMEIRTSGDNFVSELKSSSDKLSLCNSEFTSAGTSLTLLQSKYDADLATLRSEIQNKNQTILDIQKGYNELAKNTANNLCCKARIDNSNINSYSVRDNMVICSENGEFSITC